MRMISKYKKALINCFLHNMSLNLALTQKPRRLSRREIKVLYKEINFTRGHMISAMGAARDLLLRKYLCH